jgi:DNA mismatch repair protein MutL
MGVISVLDDNMINMIAAGEVIERPASVVKELVENSIDSGATRVDIAIEEGGRKLISVADDGCGMDAEDLGQAFEPHTTSKIRTSKDLRAITTLGFRGEALASIASVSAIKAISRPQDLLQGYSIEIDCGAKSEVKPCSCGYGTRIEVRDLFYKLPARRKFLRTVNTEMTHVIEQFTRIALANLQLDLSLSHNGRELYNLPGSQSLLNRITGLFSEDIAQGLIETQSEEKGLSIRAFLGRPDISRTSNKLQYVFLNGRFIRDKFISHAMREAYRTFLESERFGVVFLFIQMPYEDYDVNVHPTKIEVRFYNANLVHSQVLAVLREKLLGSDLDVKGKIPIRQTSAALPPQSKEEYEQTLSIRRAMDEFFKKHRLVETQSRLNLKDIKTSSLLKEQSQRTGSAYEPLRQGPLQQTQLNFLQIHDSYIVVQTQEGFEILDQHALHERVLYNQLKQRIISENLQSQKLLLPESFEVSVSQQRALEENLEIFEKLGLEVVPFGPKAVAVQSFPDLLSKANPIEFVRDLLDLLADKGKQFDAEALLDEVINMAACKGAIKARQKLTATEIEQLLADRQQSELASRCAHGRPTVLKFSLSDLEKQFKRT